MKKRVNSKSNGKTSKNGKKAVTNEVLAGQIAAVAQSVAHIDGTTRGLTKQVEGLSGQYTGLSKQIELVAGQISDVTERLTNVEQNMVTKAELKDEIGKFKEEVTSKFNYVNNRLDDIAIHYEKKESHSKDVQKLSRHVLSIEH